jgi:hypothetical protein
VEVSVGREEELSVSFQVHKHILLQYPFFKAALREDAYKEGNDNKISFPEEDPRLFRHVIEYLYEGQCAPRIISEDGKPSTLDTSLLVVRNLKDAEPEEYGSSLEASVGCGAHLTTDDTLSIVTTIIKLACLGHRYLLDGLHKHCLQKLQLCPFGTREVAALVKHILTQVPNTQASAEIYRFLDEKVRVHRLRLYTCPAFQQLFANPSLSSCELLELLSTGQSRATDFVHENMLEGFNIAFCITEVKVSDCVAKYGPDDASNYVTKFGSAKKGEAFLTKSKSGDSRGIFVAKNFISTTNGEVIMAFPWTSFRVVGCVIN